MHGNCGKIRAAAALGCAVVMMMGSGCVHGRAPWASSPGTIQSATHEQPRHLPCIWPVDNEDRYISSGYGVKRRRHTHKGADIIAPKGAPVRATADGVVTESGYNGAYGQVLVVEHDGGYSTYYAHLAKRYMKPGQRVGRGEIIAEVGSTGNATCTHLHYEVRKNGAPVNPKSYLP